MTLSPLSLIPPFPLSFHPGFQRTSLGAATLSNRFHPPDVALTPSTGNQRRTRTRLAGQRPRRVDCPRDTQWDKSGDVQEEDLGADRSGDGVRRLPTCSSEAASVFIGAVLRAGLPSSCAIPSGSSWSHRVSGKARDLRTRRRLKRPAMSWCGVVADIHPETAV